MSIRSFFGVLAVVGLLGVHAQAQDDIVGGTLVPGSDVIAQSTVMLTDKNALCTASIIDTDLLITAGHCVTDVGQLIVIFALDMDKATSADTRDVVNFAVTDKWAHGTGTGKDQGDIAIVHFSGGLPKGYAPAKMFASTLTNGESVVLAGFGITAANTQNGVGKLRKVNVTVKSATFGKTEVELDQTNDKGACHGDSGGPAFVQSGSQELLWGVTNRGYPDNAPDDCVHDSIYTKISSYTTWLSQQAAILRQK